MLFTDGYFSLSCSRENFHIAVDAEEIKRLGKRFRKLDLDQSGSLSVEEFMSLPELHQNPLVQRVIDIFDTDGNGEVDFKGKLHIFNSILQLFSDGTIIIVVIDIFMFYEHRYSLLSRCCRPTKR